MPSKLLLEVLREPRRLADCSLGDWDQLLAQLRATRLFGSLVATADRLGISGKVPAPLAWHFEAARAVSRRHDQLMRYEIDCLTKTLTEVDTPIVLLKGTAYRMLGLPLADGRISGDLDLLVQRDKLAEAEAALGRDGWVEDEMTPEQQQYFRRWLHELPPLMHRVRGTKLDVHHNILPAIDDLQVDAELLLAAAEPIPANQRLSTLAPTDMVLHCAAHLFRNGHYDAGLRDLSDFKALFEHFSTDAAFIEQLFDRAEQVNLRLPLYLALRYCEKLLGPIAAAKLVAKLRPQRPNRLLLAALDRLVPLAVLPAKPGRSTAAARAPIGCWPATRSVCGRNRFCRKSSE